MDRLLCFEIGLRYLSHSNIGGFLLLSYMLLLTPFSINIICNRHCIYHCCSISVPVILIFIFYLSYYIHFQLLFLKFTFSFSFLLFQCLQIRLAPSFQNHPLALPPILYSATQLTFHNHLFLHHIHTQI